MKKTLYLMRHGETEFNKKKRIQGWTDSPLTQNGIDQAKKAKEWFEKNKIQFTHAYCSTSERASDTLELITTLSYKRLKGLKEMNFGKFDGESESLNPPLDQYDTFFSVYGNGETRAQVQQRMNETITNIMEHSDHESVLIVSHGGAIANFYRKWENESSIKKNEPFYNCCILKYTYEDGKFILENVVNENKPAR